jgi:hypothetical protein
MMALIVVGALSVLAGLALLLWGVAQLALHRKARTVDVPHTVTLKGHGVLPPEPGVLLNTLWAHLPNAECQSGECGGCKVQLLSGDVKWVQEPVVDVNRTTHFLACSCVASSPIHCKLVDTA